MTAARTRRRVSPGGALLSVLAGLAVPLMAAAARPANVDGPLPGHTGGFGEPTCTACHMGPEADDVTVRIEGLPSSWQPGETYRFDLVLEASDLRRAGFQLAARFQANGEQAGTLAVEEGAGTVTTGENGVQYAHHVYDGTTRIESGAAHWKLVWTAPAEGTGGVAFHVAANATNDDNSEFGDRIVTASDTVKPAK